MIGNALLNASQGYNYGVSNSKNTSGNVPDKTAKDPLRQHSKTGDAIPDPEAKGTKHSQLGVRKSKQGDYKQVREFDETNKPVKDIDFSDHNRPQDHPNPHQHKWSGAGTRKRGEQEPL